MIDIDSHLFAVLRANTAQQSFFFSSISYSLYVICVTSLDVHDISDQMNTLLAF